MNIFWPKSNCCCTAEPTANEVKPTETSLCGRFEKLLGDGLIHEAFFRRYALLLNGFRCREFRVNSGEKPGQNPESCNYARLNFQTADGTSHEVKFDAIQQRKDKVELFQGTSVKERFTHINRTISAYIRFITETPLRNYLLLPDGGVLKYVLSTPRCRNLSGEARLPLHPNWDEKEICYKTAEGKFKCADYIEIFEGKIGCTFKGKRYEHCFSAEDKNGNPVLVVNELFMQSLPTKTREDLEKNMRVVV